MLIFAVEAFTEASFQTVAGTPGREGAAVREVLEADNVGRGQRYSKIRALRNTIFFSKLRLNKPSDSKILYKLQDSCHMS